MSEIQSVGCLVKQFTSHTHTQDPHSCVHKLMHESTTSSITKEIMCYWLIKKNKKNNAINSILMTNTSHKSQLSNCYLLRTRPTPNESMTLLISGQLFLILESGQADTILFHILSGLKSSLKALLLANIDRNKKVHSRNCLQSLIIYTYNRQISTQIQTAKHYRYTLD